MEKLKKLIKIKKNPKIDVLNFEMKFPQLQMCLLLFIVFGNADGDRYIM